MSRSRPLHRKQPSPLPWPDPPYPGYDVLAKRDTPSWNEATRRVIDARLNLPAISPRYFDATRYETLVALAARIVPSRPDAPTPVAALLDARCADGPGEGYRDHRLPPLGQAWRIGLAALDASARAAHGRRFAGLDAEAADALLRGLQAGEAPPAGVDWQGLEPKLFFAKRVLQDLAAAYYSHPSAWSEIGFGGPASPRGYVRMDFNRRDPWEAPLVEPRDAR
ncbi:gluconate 2-dehydrogenase subunit 3 family protein [Burkholderia gladioli pv. alliicola]|uniref:gluconate 2-dehydrogenase subunit 3 family protein n=1 Tax=Burkholderia gladioli TaxID=28095 RepID=UPI00163FEF88|nr:gluconate 2-dehydrogenase subunit 3 family protein [Burkholderia gladioli]